MSVKMKRQKGEPPGGRRFRLAYFLLFVAVVYLVFIAFKFPALLEIASGLSTDNSNVVGLDNGSVKKGSKLEVDYKSENVPLMRDKKWIEYKRIGTSRIPPFKHQYGRVTNDSMTESDRTSDLSELERMADEAWNLGLKAWEDIGNDDGNDINESSNLEGKPESCPSWIELSGKDLVSQDHVIVLPCGLAAGSSITVVGTPHQAHQEYVPQLARFRNGDPLVMVSQFNVELQGLKAVEGEAPPKIMHLNPRLRGDWSRRPVIEHNTCYRMQWGRAHRCDGRPSLKDDDMLSKATLSSELFIICSSFTIVVYLPFTMLLNIIYFVLIWLKVVFQKTQ